MVSDEIMEAIAAVAQEYYDSDNAFNFYRQVWGGEHIHVGLYNMLQGDDAKLEGVPRITKASTLNTNELLSRCFPSDGPASDTCTLMDMGSGYGGTARAAAKEYGCKVVCINVSRRENGVSAALTKAAGLGDKVTIPGEKSFFETGLPDASCDVVFSQDALLHAGSERHKAVAEAARTLKPGGKLVFTDIMQSEDADPKDLKEVYDRIHLDDMATPESYQRWGKEYGLEFVEFADMTENVKLHYGAVKEVLLSRRGDLEGVEDSFIDNMARGLDAWTSAADRDLIRWGFTVLKKPANDVDAIAATAQGYYDSDNAFNFYRQVWGGEHIHVGLYNMLQGDDAKLEGVPRITKASTLNTNELLSRCFPLDGPASDTCTLMDMGSGYGGTARAAAKEYGCKVVCINIARRENGVNAALTKAAGLEDKVSIPGEKSFFETGLPDASCDVVCSQDALLHAGSERHKAVAEAARTLKPGGRLVFTDIMQSENADPKDLKEVYDRIHLDDMATPKAYKQYGADYGLEFVEFVDMSENVKTHYGSVSEGVLASRRGELKGMDEEFIDNMIRGVDAWTSAAGRDLIRWGIMVFKKS